MRPILCALLIAASGYAQSRYDPRPLILGPFAISGNYPRDLYGPADTRPYTWGHAEADSMPITFTPPEGYRVRILRISGDLVAWPKDDPGKERTPRLQEREPLPKGYAGVLAGFSTTGPEGSVRCDYCADNCLVYIQDATDGHKTRAAFDRDVFDNGRLQLDHKLIVKLADFLNTLNVPVHMEVTYTIGFRYELITTK